MASRPAAGAAAPVGCLSTVSALGIAASYTFKVPKRKGRTSGRRRDERAGVAIIDAVLDLVSGGATLSGPSLVTIAKIAGCPATRSTAAGNQGRAVPGRAGVGQPESAGTARPPAPART
jgi:hypothetical protein